MIKYEKFMKWASDVFVFMAFAVATLCFLIWIKSAINAENERLKPSNQTIKVTVVREVLTQSWLTKCDRHNLESWAIWHTLRDNQLGFTDTSGHQVVVSGPYIIEVLGE